MNREPININNDDAQHEVLKAWQDKKVKDSDPCKDSFFFPIGSRVVVQC